MEVEGADGAVALNLSLAGVRLGQLRDGAAIGIFEDARGALLQIGTELLPDPGPFGENATLPTTHDERHVFAGLDAIPGVDGVLLARHRELDTRAGAWMSPDPLGLGGGLHRQRYAEGDPLGFVDPLGLTAGPITGVFGASTSSGGGRFNTPSFGGLASPNGGVWDPCAASPESCGGQQAGGRRSTLSADDDPEADVDAGKSARKERRAERRAERRGAERIWSTVFPGQGTEGEAMHVMWGWNSVSADSRRDHSVLGSLQAFRGRINKAWITVKSALRPDGEGPARGEREGPGDRLRAWWSSTFPDGRSGDGGWRRWSAYRHGQDAALINYGADTLENLPGLLRLGGLRPLADPLAGAIQRTGWVERLRADAEAEYHQGLAEDETFTALGGWTGLGVAVLVDVAMPGPGGESKVAGELVERTDEAAAALARVGDEVAEVGADALARVGDDGVSHSGDGRRISSALERAPLKPTQPAISRPKVERFAEAMKAGDEFPPIKVDGDLIVEGHHRYVASRLTGVEVPTTPGGVVPKDVKAAAPKDWGEVIVSPEDW